ncbi:uncharacterized protein [Physcomitrium patens]|uniref:uncharacterized protein n=1 Tax=Physcomitrium patens TaxID=3218 RepID=UPI003CCCA708
MLVVQGLFRKNFVEKASADISAMFLYLSHCFHNLSEPFVLEVGFQALLNLEAHLYKYYDGMNPSVEHLLCCLKLGSVHHLSWMRMLFFKTSMLGGTSQLLLGIARILDLN